MSAARPLSFGALLKRLRRAQGWTQAQLAEESGCSTVYISMLERGTRKPAADVVTSLAEALELDPEQNATFLAAARLRSYKDVLDDASRAVLSMLSQDASIHTFLIANVRGSTRFTLEYGDEAAARLAARFAQLVRETVEQRAGRVFAFRGAEARAMFVSARQALHAAVELQERCAAATAADPTLPLSVGIGLDAGEAVPVADHYHGAALIVTERLCTLSGPGEVLASTTVVHLARAIPGLVYRDRGEISLNGEPEPVHVMRILTNDKARVEASNDHWNDLLRGTGEDNLPIQLTSFIGRTRELGEVKELLATTRLLTLTGAGGTGKTRLALEAAADWRERFPQGAWLVELAALTDPQLVIGRTAHTLAIRQEAGTPLLQTLADALRHRQLLIVLDNCEHLLHTCAELVDALLQACPELHILATSRKPLGIAGETVLRVPPLSRPEPHPLLLLKDLPHAVRGGHAVGQAGAGSSADLRTPRSRCTSGRRDLRSTGWDAARYRTGCGAHQDAVLRRARLATRR